MKTTKAREAVSSLRMTHDVKAVYLAGDFDGWNPTPMPPEDHASTTCLELYPGEYQNKFIVDGVWRDDPHAMATASHG